MLPDASDRVLILVFDLMQWFVYVIICILSVSEYKIFSPLLHPIAMNSPSGSYLLVKPGEGNIAENYSLAE